MDIGSLRGIDERFIEGQILLGYFQSASFIKIWPTLVQTDPAIKNNDHRYVRQLNLVLHLMYERYFFHIYRIYALQCFCSD